MSFDFPPRRVIVPIDTLASSERALGFARLVHEKFGSRVTVLHAQHFEPPLYFSSGQVEGLKRELKRSLRAAEGYYRTEASRYFGFEPEIQVLEASPSEAILNAASDPEVDLVAMGTHGRRGAQRFWLGSVAESVLRLSPKPVLAARMSSRHAAFGEILCPLVSGESPARALDFAVRIAAASSARLRVLRTAGAEEELSRCPELTRELRSQCNIEDVSRLGDPALQIIEDAASRHPDLIVMGGERREGSLAGLFSNTTELVLQRAEAPLLVVPAV